MRTYPPRRSFQGGLAKEAKDGWHLTRLIHLVVADMAKGAPLGALLFSPPEVQRQRSEKNRVREPLLFLTLLGCTGRFL